MAQGPYTRWRRALDGARALDGLRKGGRMGYAEPLHLAACAAGEAAAAFGSLLGTRRVSAVVLPMRCVGWRRGTRAVRLRRCAAMMLRRWPSRGMVVDGCVLARGGAAVLTRRCVGALDAVRRVEGPRRGLPVAA